MEDETMIAVIGATGHTGEKIARALLAAGQPVRALGRSEGKLADLARAGAEARAGDAADAAFLAGAFRGADAVYALLPTDRGAPDYRARQDQEGEAIALAIREAGVPYVVALSSLGADRSDAPGVIAGLHAQEERLRRLAGTNVLLLRPASFLENLADQLAVIEAVGVVADAVDPDLAVPMVATRDVAAAAARALLDRDWTGLAARELLGPRDLSHREAARVIGQCVGRPDLAYVQLAGADMVGALTAAGLSRSFAELYVAMARGFGQPWSAPRAGRTDENTTPTSLEDLVDELTGRRQPARAGGVR